MTHFMDEAERLYQRLAIIDSGKRVAEEAPRHLSQQHIEAQVVEVYGEDAPGWAEREAGTFSQCVEVSGEAAFCYVEDAAPLLAHLTAWPALRTLHRPANLRRIPQSNRLAPPSSFRSTPRGDALTRLPAFGSANLSIRLSPTK